MERSIISEMILQNAMILYGQPKWTFGKNTCNTYELFVHQFRLPDGTLAPAWPILEVVEQDDALTMLFSMQLMWEAARKTMEISRIDNSNLTLSLNLLPPLRREGRLRGAGGKLPQDRGHGGQASAV